MKSIKRIFFLLSFISVSYLSTFAQENQSYFLHTIEKVLKFILHLKHVWSQQSRYYPTESRL